LYAHKNNRKKQLVGKKKRKEIKGVGEKRKKDSTDRN
jgi:hypothetical protein